jgi:methionyl-tRNA synthetase
MVTYEEFKKLDIRVAKVISAEDHPNADRLYVLKIDTGVDTRTIVAGIKNFYKKEELLDKNIVVITNLEPAMIRGVESNGMLLAASDDNGIYILTPDKNPLPGSKIS